MVEEQSFERVANYNPDDKVGSIEAEQKIMYQDGGTEYIGSIENQTPMKQSNTDSSPMKDQSLPNNNHLFLSTEQMGPVSFDNRQTVKDSMMLDGLGAENVIGLEVSRSSFQAI